MADEEREELEDEDFDIEKDLDRMAEEGERIALEIFEQYHKDGKFIIAYNFNTPLFARKKLLQSCLRWGIIIIEKGYRQNQGQKSENSAKIEFSSKVIRTVNFIESVAYFQYKNNITTKFLLEHMDEVISQQTETLNAYGNVSVFDLDDTATLEDYQERIRLSNEKERQRDLVKGLEIYRIYLKSIKQIK